MKMAQEILSRRMRPEFLEPASLKEAVAMLATHGARAKLLAGGTDLIVDIKEKRASSPECLLSLGQVSELNRLEYRDDTGLVIGALVRVRDLETSPVVKEKYPVLAYAAGTIGSRQIRNLATAVGNICNASPAADLAPALLVLEAQVKIVSSQGERLVKLEQFFTGPGQSVLKPEEMVAEIRVPPPPPGSSAVYMKHSVRRAMDIALVGVAVLVKADAKKNIVADYRVALGAVASTPVRARRAEEILKGKTPQAEIILEAAQVASGEAQPISDIRSSAEYRQEIVRVLVKRATRKALELD